MGLLGASNLLDLDEEADMIAQGPPFGIMPEQRAYPHGPQIHRVPEVIDRWLVEFRNGTFRCQPQERRDGIHQGLEHTQGCPPARDELVDVAEHERAPGLVLAGKDVRQAFQIGEMILPRTPVLPSCGDVGRCPGTHTPIMRSGPSCVSVTPATNRPGGSRSSPRSSMSAHGRLLQSSSFRRPSFRGYPWSAPA